MRWLKTVAIAVSVLVTGCATSMQYNYQYTPKNQTLGFEVKDDRAQEEKEGEIMSLVITSDQYGIYRLGDDQVIPDRVKYVSELFASKANARFNGKTVSIKKFEIFNNQQNALRGSSLAGSLGGIVGAAIHAAADPEANALIEVNLAIEVDGNTYSTKAIKPYVIDRWSGITKEAVAEEIRKAMDLGVDDIIKKVSGSA